MGYTVIAKAILRVLKGTPIIVSDVPDRAILNAFKKPVLFINFIREALLLPTGSYAICLDADACDRLTDFRATLFIVNGSNTPPQILYKLLIVHPFAMVWSMRPHGGLPRVGCSRIDRAHWSLTVDQQAYRIPKDK